MRHHNSSNNLVESWVATWCFSSLDDFVWFASQRWSVGAHDSATGAVAGLQVTTTPLLGVSKKNPNGNDRHPFKRCCKWTSIQTQNSHTNLRPGGRYESWLAVICDLDARKLYISVNWCEWQYSIRWEQCGCSSAASRKRPVRKGEAYLRKEMMNS